MVLSDSTHGKGAIPSVSVMDVLYLTTLFSVLFAALFLVLFLRVRQKAESCADQDSLIPFRRFETLPDQSESNRSQDDFPTL